MTKPDMIFFPRGDCIHKRRESGLLKSFCNYEKFRPVQNRRARYTSAWAQWSLCNAFLFELWQHAKLFWLAQDFENHAQKQHSLMSMKKLLFHLKNFLLFLKSTGDKSQKTPFNSWETQIETYLRSICKPATQEAIEKREERYNQIPPVEVLSKTLKCVRELLQEALCQFPESGELSCKRRKQGGGPHTLTMRETFHQFSSSFMRALIVELVVR